MKVVTVFISLFLKKVSRCNFLCRNLYLCSIILSLLFFLRPIIFHYKEILEILLEYSCIQSIFLGGTTKRPYIPLNMVYSI